MRFAEFNSPLKFRKLPNLIRWIVDPEKENHFVLDQQFYISEVMKSAEIKPEEVWIFK